MKIGRQSAADTLRNFSPDLYREAYKRKMYLSEFLERYVDPTDRNDKSGLDAFGRLIREAGIITQSVPSIGLWADEFDVFSTSDQTRALVPEFLNRTWRRVQTGADPNLRSLILSDDFALNTSMRPYVDAAAARFRALTPPIPLAMLVAQTTPIDNNAYRTMTLVENAENQRMVRVGEGAELPRAKLTASEATVQIYKYGRALETSYEQLRRMRIDMIAFHIARLAVQAEVDKVSTALDVLINGDGNSNTAATVYAQTTLHSGSSAGTLTSRAWLAFKLKFAAPYAVQVALAREATALDVMLLNIGTANVLVQNLPATFGGLRPINPGLADTPGFGWTDDAPTNKIVGIDTRFALERVVEIGSDINEVERYVTRQTQALTFSENEGYAVLDPNATKILDIAS